ncbi:MAG: pirin family protein [Pseudomonadota bacterium]
MSWNPALDPHCPTGDEVDSIETLIVPRARDIGAFEVRRALPSPKRQMVGPFIFFDQMGPAEMLTDEGMDVRPHPHIGLGTVTYLYQGGIMHRDSLGYELEIEPGAVNWMVAGRGITHSERSSAERRRAPQSLFGIQTWVALPDEAEDVDAAFHHHPQDALPFLEDEGKQVRLIMGHAYGERAPVQTFSDMFYADAVLAPGAGLPLPDDHEDRGIYVATGSITVGNQVFEAGRMMIFRPGDKLSVHAGPQGARLVLLGGETFNGPRYIWWNFVASSKERIEEAKEAWRAGDWQNGRFHLPPTDKDEHIPLPEK